LISNRSQGLQGLLGMQLDIVHVFGCSSQKQFGAYTHSPAFQQRAFGQIIAALADDKGTMLADAVPMMALIRIKDFHDTTRMLTSVLDPPM
jgi:hypothetical protein